MNCHVAVNSCSGLSNFLNLILKCDNQFLYTHVYQMNNCFLWMKEWISFLGHLREEGQPVEAGREREEFLKQKEKMKKLRKKFKKHQHSHSSWSTSWQESTKDACSSISEWCLWVMINWHKIMWRSQFFSAFWPICSSFPMTPWIPMSKAVEWYGLLLTPQ